MTGLAKLQAVFQEHVISQSPDAVVLGGGDQTASADALLGELAKRFGLEIISIEQLIAHRRVREKLDYREAEAVLPTKYGARWQSRSIEKSYWASSARVAG